MPDNERGGSDMAIENPVLEINPDSSVIMKQPENKGTNLLNADHLKDLLPVEISGFEKFAPNFGGTIDGEYSWTSASCEYYHKSGGFYSISVFDYGYFENVPDKGMFDSAIDVSGFETGTYGFEYGKVYFKWQPELRTGDLFALVFDRIIVQIKANNLPKNSPDLKYVLKMFDFKKIRNKIAN